MTRFDILTIFPEVISPYIGSGIIGRACEAGLIQINTINFRNFSIDKHHKVDDYPYGGGSGMVLMAQPIYDAYMSIISGIETKPRVIYMTPQGRLLDQQAIISYSGIEHMVILCGHYEGVDERVIEEIVDDEVSIGDYVLTGGELPAMVFVDAVSRMIPGVLAGESSYSDESLFSGLLEYPQYTRPYDFNGRLVPDVLVSGHHSNIEKWRRTQSILRTRSKRPDLYKKLDLDDLNDEYLKPHGQ